MVMETEYWVASLKTTHLGITSPNNSLNPKLATLYKLRVAQKRYNWRQLKLPQAATKAVFLTCTFFLEPLQRAHLLFHSSGSSSPLKWLSEPCEAGAALGPVLNLRACLLPIGSSRSPETPKRLQSRFWSRCPQLYKACEACEACLWCAYKMKIKPEDQWACKRSPDILA